MNPKRHAEIHRKLTMTPAPKPPAGLLERIKNDIPDYLQPEVERARFARSISFNMRVAAAVMVVISSVVATVYLLEPEQQLSKSAMRAPAPVAVTTPYVDTTSATGELRVEISQQAPAPPAVQVANASPERSAQGLRRDERAEEEERDPVLAVAAERSLDAGSGAVAGAAAPAPMLTMADLAPPSAPPAVSPAEPQRAEESITITAQAPMVEQRAAAKFARPSLVPEAQAADLDLGSRTTVFGISVDPAVFHRIKDTLEKNQRPSASAADLEAIVNYFAGSPSRQVRGGVRLDVEGSPSPVGRDDHGFLRFTIDTAEAASALPVAANASLEIDLNGKAVEHATPVGDSAVSGAERALLPNLSVTGLYELTLRPNLRLSDRVATVRLSYTDVKDGKRRTTEKVVYARDFGKLWTRASRRHRLASLGAVWGQTLRSTAPAPEVAKRAEELATQNPQDQRAQELATAATASEKLNSGF